MNERLTVFFGSSLLVLLGMLSACNGSAPDEGEDLATPTPTRQQQSEGAPREELETLEEELNTADLSIEIDRGTEQLHTGNVVTYEMTVVNNGPNPATDVRAVSFLPDELSYVDDDAGCSQESSREVICDLGEIPARETVSFQIAVRVEPGTHSEPTVRYEATVENRAGPDPDTENNRAVDEAEYGGTGARYSIVA